MTGTSTGPAIDAPWLDIRRVAVYGTPPATLHRSHLRKASSAGTTLEVIIRGTTDAQLAFGRRT